MYTYLSIIISGVIGYVLTLTKINYVFALSGNIILFISIMAIFLVSAYSTFFTASMNNTYCSLERVLLEEYVMSKNLPELRSKIIEKIARYNFDVLLQKKCMDRRWSVVFTSLLGIYLIDSEKLKSLD